MLPELDDRDKSILQGIISSYILTGEPVGSRFLSKKLDINLSPATIRNIMSDLEELGFLKQPHVSAGRVPTDKAYRFFVDALITHATPAGTPPEVEAACKFLRSRTSTLMREASRALSDVSHYVGLVMASRPVNLILRHVEFIRLEKGRVLVVLVSQEGLIQNKVIAVDRDYTQDELTVMGNVLNESYMHRSLSEARAHILHDMGEEKAAYDSLLSRAMDLGRQALEDHDLEGDLFVEGTSNIISLPDFADIEKMRSIFRAFEEKGQLIQLLDLCSEAEGVRIFIGAENPYRELRDLSVITAPYQSEGHVLGVIGVIGPTRMEYSRVIPTVAYTANHLSRILSGFGD